MRRVKIHLLPVICLVLSFFACPPSAHTHGVHFEDAPAWSQHLERHLETLTRLLHDPEVNPTILRRELRAIEAHASSRLGRLSPGGRESEAGFLRGLQAAGRGNPEAAVHLLNGIKARFAS